MDLPIDAAGGNPPARRTHLRDPSVIENGTEKANPSVTLAGKIAADECALLHLGYVDLEKTQLEE